jgi:hypothetical protein
MQLRESRRLQTVLNAAFMRLFAKKEKNLYCWLLSLIQDKSIIDADDDEDDVNLILMLI